VKAGTGDSGSGWLWGGSDNGAGSLTGISWIGMNRTNCDTNNSGSIDVLDTGPAGCPPLGTVVADYGINIPAGDGVVTGYAWSGGGDDGTGVGWIDFEPQTHCGVNYSATSCADPDGGIGGVSRSSDSLVGWARIVGIAEASVTGNSGGWTGWIKMSGTAQDGNAYGVTIKNDGSFCKAGDSTTFEVAGDGLDHCAAWSGSEAPGGTELGFIDFRQAAIVTPKTLKICENSCDSGIMRAIEGTPDNLSVAEGALARNLKVCYNSVIDCSDVNGNKTADVINTSWTETAVTGDAFSLSAPGTDPKVMSFNAVVANTTENLSVTYTDAGTPHTTDFDVTVVDAACVPDCTCAATTCIGDTCDDGCGGTCAGTLGGCPVGTNWHEVAP